MTPMDSDLAERLLAVESAVARLSQAMHSHLRPATHHDLLVMEARLIEALRPQAIDPVAEQALQSLLAHSRRIARRLQALDSQTPPAPPHSPSPQ